MAEKAQQLKQKDLNYNDDNLSPHSNVVYLKDFTLQNYFQERSQITNGMQYFGLPTKTIENTRTSKAFYLPQ